MKLPLIILRFSPVMGSSGRPCDSAESAKLSYPHGSLQDRKYYLETCVCSCREVFTLVPSWAAWELSMLSTRTEATGKNCLEERLKLVAILEDE